MQQWFIIQCKSTVKGDAAVSCIIAKSENKLDEAVFNDLDAGAVENESAD